MKSRRITLLLALGAAACAGVQQPSNPSPAAATQTSASLRAQLDALVQPLVDSGWLRGVAVAVVTPDGSVVAGYGSADGSGRRVDGDTVFEIGSLTKVFTSTVLADMVLHGEARLDEPVAALLPPGTRVPERDGAQITLEHLATHTSGLPRMPSNFTPADPANPYADYTVEQLFAFLAGHALRRAPGEQAEYSNLGVGLLGHALSARAGRSYEQLVRERVLEPLDMGDTAIALSEGQRARFADGFDADGEPASHWNAPTLAGAGALCSTANDLQRFLRANLGLVATPLAPAFELAQTPRRPLDPSSSVSLGWLYRPEKSVVWHNGQTGGFHSFFAFQKAKGLGVAVLSNNGSPLVDKLGSAILKMLRGEPHTVEAEQPAKVAAEVLARYVGSYELGPGAVLAVTLHGDRLKAQLTGQSAAGLYPANETEFFYRVVTARILFESDAEGHVTGLTLRQNGADHKARRLP